jgi:hypothetical protein
MRQFFLAPKSATALVPLLALAVSAGPAAAANLVLNGSFEIATATITTVFPAAGVADWTDLGGGEALVLPSWYTNGYLFPGPPPVGFAGSVPQTSPDGGNFVFSDSDYLTGAIQQTISGLTLGDSYDLSFFQALAQDTEPGITVPGPVSAHWDVSLGASTQSGASMTANGSIPTFSPWTQQTMSFTATSATEVLSFLAVGSGDPPLALLDGVSLVDSAPEPAGIWLAGIGAALLGWRLFTLRSGARRRAAGIR